MQKPDGKVNIKRQDWLLIVAIILAPMTEFRIWKVGPAEALCLLWCVMQYKHILAIWVKDSFLKFWLVFLCASLFGTCIGEWLYPAESDIKSLLTWFYFAVVSIATYSGLRLRTTEQLARILLRASCGAATWYLLLYLYSRTISTLFLGARLWYGFRFTGGAGNPHQVALLLCVIVLVLLYAAVRFAKGFSRLLLVVLAGASTFLLSETASTTALAAMVCGIAILGFTEVFRTTRTRIIFALIIFLIVLINAESLYRLFMAWVASDVNGMGRFDIFAEIFDVFWKSPLFGLGPGAHADGIEFHNTYLEVLAMSGLVGFFVFLRFSVDLFRKAYWSPCSFAVLTALYVYGLAGFGMRRLVYWILISFVVCIAEKVNENEQRT